MDNNVTANVGISMDWQYFFMTFYHENICYTI